MARNARVKSMRAWHYPAIGADSCRSDLRLWKAEKGARRGTMAERGRFSGAEVDALIGCPF